MKVVIMAGGKGTRISSITSDIPKPMIPIEGVPVLEREIICLREQGLTDLLITVGHLGHIIMEHFGDGSQFGVKIEYYVEKKPLGNAGALYRLKDKLTEDFFLLNADVIFEIDFHRFYEFHKKKGGLATIFTHPNSHPYDSGLIIADQNLSVQNWLTKEDIRPMYYKNRVNAGLHILSKKLFKCEIQKEKIDLDRDILKPLSGTGDLFCYDSPEYVRDMGTPDRYYAVCSDYCNGIVKSKNLKRKQKAIFLDRDGTINKYVGFLQDIEKFELIDGVAETIAKINQTQYLVIVVTNQPVVARGEVTFEELEHIHNKMETLLGKKGAYVDAIYYCPHHPDRGFVGEIANLKVVCNCRKPKPGMLLQAASDFNIDLKSSWMIGDGQNDIEAGKNAGCHTALLGTENFNQDITLKEMRDILQVICRGEKR